MRLWSCCVYLYNRREGAGWTTRVGWYKQLELSKGLQDTSEMCYAGVVYVEQGSESKTYAM